MQRELTSSCSRPPKFPKLQISKILKIWKSWSVSFQPFRWEQPRGHPQTPWTMPRYQGATCFLYSSLTENRPKNIQQDAVAINKHLKEDRYWIKGKYKRTFMKRYGCWALWSPTRVGPRMGFAQVWAKYKLQQVCSCVKVTPALCLQLLLLWSNRAPSKPSCGGTGLASCTISEPTCAQWNQYIIREQRKKCFFKKGPCPQRIRQMLKQEKY